MDGFVTGYGLDGALADKTAVVGGLISAGQGHKALAHIRFHAHKLRIRGKLVPTPHLRAVDIEHERTVNDLIAERQRHNVRAAFVVKADTQRVAAIYKLGNLV